MIRYIFMCINLFRIKFNIGDQSSFSYDFNTSVTHCRQRNEDDEDFKTRCVRDVVWKGLYL